jgi:hypothetical protein
MPLERQLLAWLQVVSRVPGAQLLIVGTGPYEPRLAAARGRQPGDRTHPSHRAGAVP